MKKKIILLCCCYLSAAYTFCQDTAAHIAIIPEPVKLVQNTGTFSLPATITIEAPDLAAVTSTVQFLEQRIKNATGYSISHSTQAAAPTIKLSLNKTANQTIGTEGYLLISTPTNITIVANQAAGLFYGVQTLLQLLPKEIESNTVMAQVKWQLPCMAITDYPRFGWRGLMFDVSRHFFTKQEVKDFINQMARYKLNLFHWHLTDDEGWRVEIKSLPLLTTKGAMRVTRTGYFGDFSQPLPNELADYGGFYTQEDIKEVVDYAKARFVNILPEVDVPGHSMAAIVAYPELSCTPGADKYHVRAGEKTTDWHDDGTFTALVDNTLCPANEKVYVFLDKVFTELAPLFPFEYIHVGGDECSKDFWKKSDAIATLMKKENLKTMNEVQSYFEKRIGKIVASKKKKLIGWDEILEGGIADDAAVMSWRGEQAGVQATNMKHEVVMSPTTFTYLDYMQGDEALEPKVYATLRLNKTYEFDPVPAGANAKYIKGGQANIWTEQISNTRHLQYMTWPRSFAIAECVWSPKEKKNWNGFVQKVEQHFKRNDISGVKYSPSIYDPIFTATDTSGNLQVTVATEIDGLDIYYTFDNSFPDKFYPKYLSTLTWPKDAVMLNVITYRKGEPIGRLISMPLSEMQKRAGIKK